LLGTLERIMREAFSSLGRGELTPAAVHQSALAIVMEAGVECLLFAAILAATGTMVGLIQTRGLVSTHRLRPDFGRLNPIAGMRRVFSKEGFFETGKGVLKMAVLALVLYTALRDVPQKLAMVCQGGLGPGVALIGESLAKLARQSALLLLVAAGFDYLFQFMQFRKRMKMSRQEVTEEMKNAEGQPFIRNKIREMQRRWSRQRMMQQLVYADVVVTNPTHLAIALQYDAEQMPAPRVVAKGKGRIAEEIMRRARALNIPLTQNIPLAHALIHVEIDALIPVDLYQAVAEVLAFVYRLRGKAPARATEGASR
jgi:flagellar biosynthetic protein FlhB